VRVVLVSSEVAPFAKTGGLGDVVGALTRHLALAGHDVRTFLPLYGNLKERDRVFHRVAFARDVPLPMGRHPLTFTLFTTTLPRSETPVYFVACPPLYGRAETYSASGDEHLRFAFLSRAALESCQRMGFTPDVVHAHDWHAGLVPLYLKTLYAWDRERFGRTKTLLTIHNVGYQGVFRAEKADDLGVSRFEHLLPQDDLAEGRIGFLKTGILHADAVSTVSRTHAVEMTGPEYGMGLDPWLRARGTRFTGIVNGIDADEWNPSTDRHLPARYSAADLSGKATCRDRLLSDLGLAPAPRGPVLGVVSRMTAQKGFDLFHDVLPRFLRENDARFVVLGGGEGRYQRFFEGLERDLPGRVRFRGGYDDPLAHRIEAGADVFLMPSLYEPCGLNQMYSQRYGTPPVVRRTGGLADTVEPWNPATGEGTGFVFEHFTADGLSWALSQVLLARADPAAWRRLMLAGMSRDFSWTRRIREYEDLYARL
jgi:starch synthase